MKLVEGPGGYMIGSIKVQPMTYLPTEEEKKEIELVDIIMTECSHQTRNNFDKCWWQLNRTPADLAQKILKAGYRIKKIKKVKEKVNVMQKLQ